MKSNHRLCFLIALEIILLIAPLGVANAVVWPLSNSSSDFADTPTSPFGIRRHSDARIYDRHEGLDLHADCGTPVHGIEAADILELHPWDGTNSSGNWVLLVSCV